MNMIVLIAAATAEVLGDLGMRIGIGGRVWGYAAGVCLLAAYGWLVNQPAFGFGRALGLSSAVFFVVSQAVAFVALGDRPSPSLLVGGALIVAGGLVIQLGRG